jgi:hypothetical protein
MVSNLVRSQNYLAYYERNKVKEGCKCFHEVEWSCVTLGPRNGNERLQNLRPKRSLLEGGN